MHILKHFKYVAGKPISVALLFATLFAIGTLFSGCAGTVPSLTISPGSVNFGSRNVATSSPVAVTISNTGVASLTILGLTLSGPGFTVGGIPSGSILAPGQSAILTVTFNPVASGSASGSVAIKTNIAGSVVIPLFGVGVTPSGTNQVTLQWQPSPSPSVAGYNVYRSTSPGAELDTAPLNGPTPITGDSYTDTNVVAGTTYYYVVVAVTSANVYSASSNEASIVAP